MKYISLLLSLVVGFSACHEEAELLNYPSDKDLPLTDQVYVNDTGKAYPVGYGYSPLQGASYYPPAIAEDNFIEDTDFDNAAEREFRLIETQEQLDDFLASGVVMEKSLNGEYVPTTSFDYNGMIRGLVRNKLNLVVNDRYVNAIMRVKVKRVKHQVDRSPSLTSSYQYYVDNNQGERLIQRKGPYYVRAHTLGGELYFWYSFRVEERVTSRSELLGAVSSYIDYVFSENGAEPSERESYLIDFCRRRWGVTSTVGYGLASAKTPEEVSNQITEFTNYLEANPEKAATVEMELASYADVVADERVAAAFQERLACNEPLMEWKRLVDQLREIRLLTTVYQEVDVSDQLERDVYDAINEILIKISRSDFCDNPTNPGSQYQPLLDRWERERRTTPLYRFYSEERRNHYYTTDPETVNRIDGGSSYRLEDQNIRDGIECRIFTEAGNDMTWIKEFWNNDADDHRYNTQLEDMGDGNGYQLQGVIGYIYDNNNRDPNEIRPLRLYYNEEARDHMMSTDPVRDFGSDEGGNGYRFMGTLGFGLPAE